MLEKIGEPGLFEQGFQRLRLSSRLRILPVHALRLRDQFRLGLRYLAQYRDVAAFPYQEQEAIRDFQWRRIKQLLNEAYYHTQFYRQKYDAAGIHPDDVKDWRDFERLPTVTKDELVTHGREAISDRHRLDDLFLSRSSGSSGQFVDIYMDAENFIVQALQVIRMLKEFYPDYGPLDRELLVYTSEYPVRSILGLYPVTFVNNLLSPAEILAAMQRVRPAIVAAYPSILREVIEQYQSDCRPLGIKAIITNSEYSSQGERDYFGHVFGCRVFDEYSSEEIASIAYQCAAGAYHLVQDASYVEILAPELDRPSPDGTQGEIVGTCLINQAMPIIRYRQGDLGVVVNSVNCSCGKTGPILREFSGRKNASFLSPDYRTIPSGRILDWTYSLKLQHGLSIRHFQLTQKTVRQVEVAIVPGQRYNAATDDEVIARSFRDTFHTQFEVDVQLVSETARTSSGKHIPIRSFVTEA